MIKGKNVEKQLDLFRKLEEVLHRNESSCYDMNDKGSQVAFPVE
jgi:hypothetical protein